MVAAHTCTWNATNLQTALGCGALGLHAPTTALTCGGMLLVLAQLLFKLNQAVVVPLVRA